MVRGFFQVPYTNVMMRFNAKPRVDFTYDTQNPGDDSRFVPATIPVLGDPNQGGGCGKRLQKRTSGAASVAPAAK